MVVALVGAAAVVGLEPTLSLSRFAYTTLGASLFVCLLLVFRLGPASTVSAAAASSSVADRQRAARGDPGVRRGAAPLRRPGARRHPARRPAVGPGQPGGAPRPVQALLGVPALVWGTHMRARRRQGWWVCAFGVTAAAQVTHTFLDPSLTVLNAGLTTLYSVVVGVLVGIVVIRVDLLLSGEQPAPGARPARAHRGLRLHAAPRAGPHPAAPVTRRSARFGPWPANRASRSSRRWSPT